MTLLEELLEIGFSVTNPGKNLSNILALAIVKIVSTRSCFQRLNEEDFLSSNVFLHFDQKIKIKNSSEYEF